MLKEFSAGPQVIQAAVNTLCQICIALGSQKNYQVHYKLRIIICTYVDVYMSLEFT